MDTIFEIIEQPALFALWGLIAAVIASFALAFVWAQYGRGMGSTIAEHAAMVLRWHAVFLCLAALVAAAYFFLYSFDATTASPTTYVILTVYVAAIFGAASITFVAFRRL